AELVAQSVDVHVVGSGQPPQLLPSDVADADVGRARIEPPTVAVGVDGEPAVAPQRRQTGQADRVDTDHHTGSAGGQDQVMSAAHLVDLAGYVEGEHHLFAGAGGVVVDDAHDRLDPFVERAVRAVGL